MQNKQFIEVAVEFPSFQVGLIRVHLERQAEE